MPLQSTSGVAPPYRLLTPSDYRPMPWKNGAGRNDRDRRASGRGRARRVPVAGQHRRRRARRPVLALSGHRSHDRAARRRRNAFAIRRARYPSSRPASCRMTSAATTRSSACWWRDPRATSTRCSGATEREDASPSCALATRIRPTPFRLAYAAAGAHECTIAGHAPLRLPEGHALLVDATDAGSEDAAVAIRPLAAGAVALGRQRRSADEALRRRRAHAARLAARCRRRYRCRRHDRAGRAECAARWSGARGRPARAGRAEPALACVPARDRRTHGTARTRTATRSGRGGARCTHFSTAIDADAFEAIAAQAYVEMLKAGYTAVAEFHYVHHDPRGKPYADPAELAHRDRRCGRRDGHRAHAASGVLRARRILAACRPPTGQRRFVHTVDSYRARRGVARARRRARRLEARDRAAQPARRDAGRARGDRRAGAARRADPHSRGRAAKRGRGVRRMERRAAGRMAARRTRASMRAGASCTRRT